MTTIKGEIHEQAKLAVNLIRDEQKVVLKIIDLIPSLRADMNIRHARLIHEYDSKKTQQRMGRRLRVEIEEITFNLTRDDPLFRTRVVPVTPYSYEQWSHVPNLQEFNARVQNERCPNGKTIEWVANRERRRIIAGHSTAYALLVFATNNLHQMEDYMHFLWFYDGQIRGKTTGRNTTKVIEDVMAGVETNHYSPDVAQEILNQLKGIGRFTIDPPPRLTVIS